MVQFTAMTQRKEGRVIPADEFPSSSFGSLHLDAKGGSPGLTSDQSSIRRWVAPATGVVQISGTLEQTTATGDGVRGRMVSSVHGSLGEWSVHQDKAETKRAGVVVAAGETIDFVVEGLADPTADNFTWAPIVAFAPPDNAMETIARTWSAKDDFAAPPKETPPLTRWEELAQVLLLSNELAFVD